jgi:hypothetical protein
LLIAPHADDETLGCGAAIAKLSEQGNLVYVVIMTNASKHLYEKLKQRNISDLWVQRTVNDPDYTEGYNDGTRYYLKKIVENDNRWLRVVVNVKDVPNKGVTAFFDRRSRGNT